MGRDTIKPVRVTAEAARRITGISTPFGGVQWADPGPSDTEIVRKFILFLEDRRVLYNPMILEVESEVEHSIHQIREESTKTLQALPAKAFGVIPIRTIRAACRRFHDDEREDFRNFGGGPWRGRGENAGFFMALGAFRATIAQQVTYLAAHYDLDVEGDLASVLPVLETDDDVS